MNAPKIHLKVLPRLSLMDCDLRRGTHLPADLFLSRMYYLSQQERKEEVGQQTPRFFFLHMNEDTSIFPLNYSHASSRVLQFLLRFRLLVDQRGFVDEFLPT